MAWPFVQPEWNTLLELTRNGKSIARFGDGEFKMMDGKGYVREEPNKALAHELTHVLRSRLPKLCVAIPTMDPKGPKYPTWQKHTARFERLIRRAKGPFYSAFISRPDSAPWIRTKEFAAEFAGLWRGKRVTALCEKESGTLRMLADSVSLHVPCPSHGAYAAIDLFETLVVASKPEVVILSCGPTATCLAHRLAERGIQAIDFGSGGSFIAKLLE